MELDGYQKTCRSVLLQFLAGPPQLRVGIEQGGAPGPAFAAAAANSRRPWSRDMLGLCVSRLHGARWCVGKLGALAGRGTLEEECHKVPGLSGSL